MLRLWQSPNTLFAIRWSCRFSTKANEKLFDKILIANRGEIACRVIRTCKKLGIKTVAIHSEADTKSLHVMQADEAVCVGPAQSSKSYLNQENILKACLQTGAQAVHPGYGFVSENSKFAALLHDNNIKFIGPREYSIVAMGDKISSKKIARDAKVNTIPGFLGAVANDQEVIKIANEIGYPVMIKAAHGGGGKGMRIAWNDKEACDGFRMSKAEALSSFGNDTIFIEKFIEEPRHIEIQVLLDAHGNGIYANERECSIQRRNQKVVEEAPSTFLDPATRKAMGEQAVALAKAVKYESAGTVEFLVDKHRNFYFLEMNTRLQVEHPITEYITGLDLVEQMIRVAAGHTLAIKQSDIGIKGWAVESRVYAEDPLNGFLPSIGRLERYVEPCTDAGDVRVDTGVREGAEISIYYDPLISKLVTYGPDRATAVQKMREALDSYVIRGVVSNINFLRAIMDNPRWISGQLSTKFIPTEFPDGFKGHQLQRADKEFLISAAAMVLARQIALQTSTTSGKVALFNADKFLTDRLTDLVVTLKDREEQYSLSAKNYKRDAKGVATATVTLNEGKTTSEPFEVSTDYVKGQILFSVTIRGETARIQIVSAREQQAEIVLQYKGTIFKLALRSQQEQELFRHMPVPQEVDAARFVTSPMPGAIYSIRVQVGDKVVAGQEVCVVEAMKMQNAIRVIKAGVIKAIPVKVGQTVASEDLLMEVDPL
jgi:propionyl-CoA carboxylase alpha chain